MSIEAEFEPEQLDDEDEADDGLPLMHRHFFVNVSVFEPDCTSFVELAFFIIIYLFFN